MKKAPTTFPPDWRHHAARSPQPYTHLLGVDGSRQHLPTPALVIDAAALARNIARMADFAHQNHVKLRPHVKTHKCSHIARKQIAAGAIGVSCATLDEVEIMVNAKIPGVLLTSTIVTHDKLERYVRLLQQAPDTLLVVDHPEVVMRLNTLAQTANLRAGVLIDLDIGYHRSGVRTRAQVDALMHAIHAAPALRLQGVQAYSGDIQHIAAFAARQTALQQQMAVLTELLAYIQTQTGHMSICSGGGTGTHRLDAQHGMFTELQAGSYVFMDADYARIDLGACAFETALRLRASVVGVHCADLADDARFVVLDSGTKAFALNGSAPVCLTHPWQDAGFRFIGDEHASLTLNAEHAVPSIGTALEFQVSHCDPTVHHFDHFYMVQDQTLIDIWPIDARGRS